MANFLADGRVATGSTGGGVIVREVTEGDRVAGYRIRVHPTGSADVLVPWEQVVTWRVCCDCGWTGSERAAFADAQHGWRDCPDAVADRVFLPEWSGHVEPVAALYDLQDLVGQLRMIEGRIQDTVHLARAGGVSWAQVGTACGMTKQGAQQRWGSGGG